MFDVEGARFDLEIVQLYFKSVRLVCKSVKFDAKMVYSSRYPQNKTCAKLDLDSQVQNFDAENSENMKRRYQCKLFS